MSSNSASLSFHAGSNESTMGTHERPEGLTLDGPVDAEVVDVLPDLIGPSPELSSAERERAKLPWYKRPSSAWLLYGTFIAAVAMSGTIAPRVEIYIKLACQEIRPEYSTLEHGGGVIDWPSGIGAVTIPRPSAKCQADPEVQQAVAELGATITTIMGALSCLTAGWWGKFCDHYGRLKVLAITTFGVLVADITFITVALASEKLPYGYRFLIVAPIVEGVFGGLATGSAATHAYLSDTTTPANRSRVFSLMLGLLFCGMALGPSLGGLLISSTNNILSVFYVAAALHASYIVLMLFVVPESLTKEKAKANAELARQRAERGRAVRREEDAKPTTVGRRIERVVRKGFFFLRPLAVFLPHKVEGGRRRDWNLTILAGAYGMYTMLMGANQFKFQYASYAFGWNSEQLGLWLSVIGVLRAVHLIVILPLAIKFFHPSARAERTDQAPSTNDHVSPTRTRGLPHDPAFDLAIARISLGIELVQYTIATLATNITIWVSATVISSFGGGFSPSVQALAVELSNRREALMHDDGQSGENYGQLFGGLGVIQALCSQMIGPALFGSIFVATIDKYPKGIFVAGGVLVILGILLLAFIRVPYRDATDEEREPLISDNDRARTRTD